MVTKEQCNLTLMGIKPTYPSEKYGYILPEKNDESVFQVKEFKEKPDIQTAKKLIEDGAIWNSGVFAFKIGYIMDIITQYVDILNYEYMYEHYKEFPKISFDYAVVEKGKEY